MKTVVITGSARGFGLEMLKKFRENDFNIVACDVNEKALKEALEILELMNYEGKVLAYKADVTDEVDLNKMIKDILKKVDTIDIWINNAGVNQPNEAIWELDKKDIDRLLEVDLKGTILGSRAIMPIMIKQKSGQIFNVEGYGSNNATMLGLSIYGTAKRAVTYFTEALAKEVSEKGLNICVGKISPGIMITNFIGTAFGDGEKIKLEEKTKKVYNILGDYPDVIADFMVEKIIKNKKNNVKFNWLTNTKAAYRFATAGFNKRNFFE